MKRDEVIKLFGNKEDATCIGGCSDVSDVPNTAMPFPDDQISDQQAELSDVETNEPFELTCSPLQSLTFSAAEKAFHRVKIKFKTKKRKAYGLINQNGSYTQLAYLLSDQCPQTIKIAIFSGPDKTNLLDKREFTGSLLQQWADTLQFFEQQGLTNPADVTPEGTNEQVSPYPCTAIREGLSNALIHRDYHGEASILINILADRLEIVSLGGLPKGLSLNDLELGLSVLRNKRLAAVFTRLHITEACGTGLARIKASYQTFGMQPQVSFGDHAFQLTLPSLKSAESRNRQPGHHLSQNEEKVLAFLANQHQATRKAIEDQTGFSQAKTIRLLNSLISKTAVQKSGQGKNTVYAVVSGSRTSG